MDPDSDDFCFVLPMEYLRRCSPQAVSECKGEEQPAYYASRIERYKGLMVAYSGIEIANKEKVEELILKQLQEVKDGNVTEKRI